jgi:hypothetical protein
MGNTMLRWKEVKPIKYEVKVSLHSFSPGYSTDG